MGAVLACAAPAGAEDVPVDLELILAVDISRSIDMEEAELQRAGYVAALRDPDVVRAIQSGMLGRIAVTYVEWAGVHTRHTVVPWTLIETEDDAGRFAERVEFAPIQFAMWTSIGGAIGYAMPLFSANGFEGTRRVIDISGDGPNNNGPLVAMARDRAVEAGITINGLPILNGRVSPGGFPPMANLDLYYIDCVIGGPGAFIVAADGFESFGKAIRSKLITEIAGLTPDAPAPAPPGIVFAEARLLDYGYQRPDCTWGERQWRLYFGTQY